MRCHYEVLGVEQEATADELKRAYRKQALRFHPDKNPDNPSATEQFQLIQAAYAVLSDPQERAWYDKHREDILRGGTGIDGEEGVDLMPYFSSSAFSGFGDDDNGFFTVYARVFEEIFDDEQSFLRKRDETNPSFGDSTSPYKEVVAPFYAYWERFETRREFHSADKWDLREAPNRRVKRLMEKENKKTRSQCKKEYNATVKQLIKFVKRRDPRVLAYKKLAKEQQLREKEERERLQQEEEERRKAEQREQNEAARAAQMEEHEQLAEQFEELEQLADDLFGENDDADDEGNDGMYCVACNKAFKSQKQYENHSRSKKHLQRVDELRRELEQDDELAAKHADDMGDMGPDEADLSSDNFASDPDIDAEDPSEDSSASGSQNALHAASDVDDTNSHGDSDGDSDGDIMQMTLEELEALEVKDQEKESPNVSSEHAACGSEKADTGDEDVTEDSAAADVLGSDDEADLAFMLRMAAKKQDHTGHLDSGLLPEADVSVQLAEMTLDADEADAKAEPNASNQGTADPADDVDGATSASGHGAKGKGKGRRRAKKASAEQSSDQSASTEWRCNVCSQQFASRNKLYQHIKEEGHALRLDTTREAQDDSWQPKKKKKGKRK